MLLDGGMVLTVDVTHIFDASYSCLCDPGGDPLDDGKRKEISCHPRPLVMLVLQECPVDLDRQVGLIRH
jgi:hypothetical protein